jgi:mRNA-degrading endonuclease RelE of RelBE toxin-antitoxin system
MFQQICGKLSLLPRRHGRCGLTSRPLRAETGSTGLPPPSGQRPVRAGSTMPAKCSLRGSEAFAASTGLGSIVEASALLSGDLDFRALKPSVRSAVRDALETHLCYEPKKTSPSRIKRLRGLSRPQYRLRVGEIRVFYDVSTESVEVLAIVPKSEALLWLEQFGSPE